MIILILAIVIGLSVHTVDKDPSTDSQEIERKNSRH